MILHVKTLKTYLEAGVAPRGVRLSLSPAVHNLSSTEIKTWESILNSATLDLTKLISEHYERTLVSMRVEER